MRLLIFTLLFRIKKKQTNKQIKRFINLNRLMWEKKRKKGKQRNEKKERVKKLIKTNGKNNSIDYHKSNGNRK